MKSYDVKKEKEKKRTVKIIKNPKWQNTVNFGLEHSSVNYDLNQFKSQVNRKY